MKRSLLSLLTSIGLGALAYGQQEQPVGTISENVRFATFNGGLSNTQLTDFAGQIVVLYYYTPW